MRTMSVSCQGPAAGVSAVNSAFVEDVDQDIVIPAGGRWNGDGARIISSPKMEDWDS